jgi:hypothetical protein
MTKQFRDFESAREFARSLNLKSQKDWFKYCKSGNKPDDIPRNANTIYKNYFKGYGDWLGTGRTRNHRPFKEAREFVRNLGINSWKEWEIYCKSGNKPDDIPVALSLVYKNKGWISNGDFFGTGRVANYNLDFLSFESAKKFANSLNLKSVKEWQEYCKSGNKPDNIPANPENTYKNKAWVSYGDWLGTGRVADRMKEFLPYSDAKKIIHKLNLESRTAWELYVQSGNKPENIPSSPPQTYKNKDWVGWGDFLGTGTVAPKDREYLSYKEAREFVRSLGLKNANEWKEYCKSGNKPDDIPAAPWNMYKEWKK